MPYPSEAENDWWRGATIYQVYLRSFFDSNKDGVGDVPGVTAKLDYIASLGVDAIWLCPFYVSPQKDFGYDVEDYLNIDPIFGTLNDFDTLVKCAHSLGIRLLIDQVWSHTADSHLWFLQSRANRSGDKSDWYVWGDVSPDGTPPNNWLSVFGGSAWTWEPRRRQFYLHHFLAAQPSLNLQNSEVVDAVLNVGQFWLDRGVDGFRLDAIDFMTHDPRLHNNPPTEPWGGVVPLKPFALQDHIHDMLHPSRMAVLTRIRKLVEKYPGTTVLGEVSSQPGAYQRVVDYTKDRHHLHMAYTLSPLRQGFDWHSITNMLGRIHETNGEGWPCWSFSNHDVERAISRWNPTRETSPDGKFARMLAAFMLSLRGSVCIYQGEELGLTEARLTREQLRDPFGINYWPEFRGRDGSRTPIPWKHNMPHGSFTDGEHPWLPIPGDHYPLAVSLQDDDPDSLLNFWRNMLNYRHCHKALTKGSLIPLRLPEPAIGFVREYGDERMFCIFNLDDEPISMDVPELGSMVVDGYGYKFEPMPRTSRRRKKLLTIATSGSTICVP